MPPIKRPPLHEPGSRINGLLILGYGGCRHPALALLLGGLRFYWIGVEEVRFSAWSMELNTTTPIQAARAAAYLRTSPLVSHVETGRYANTDRGWCNAALTESPWYFQ